MTGLTSFFRLYPYRPASTVSGREAPALDKADLVKEDIMRLLRNSVLGLLVLAAIAAVLTPKEVLADDDGVPIKGTFVVSFMYPSAVNYCAGAGNPIEGQGLGNISTLGPLFLTVKKCGTRNGDIVTFHGTFTMTAANGDTLEGVETGTADVSLTDENGYRPSHGTFTFTGGSGKFSNVSGALSWTAVQNPTSVGVNAGTANGMVYLLVTGNIQSSEKE
jgi:hypothetical protein